ncbi:hypothetical protein DUI87_20207 [Hirundo rustica rustica]|uniref:Poly [ADP-ribose] polymerase n=1 Tax=Hirundo rustica rustica TaxID=333673 RepID=A0A3M0JV53_HIRRU|nr:hypothetical protein DUI87_20207 [Hirundo rustica rustica]
MALAIQALRVLCASGGCLEQGELRRRLPSRPSAEQLAAVLRDAQRFTLVRRPGQAAAAEAEVAVVVATSPVRLCPEHGAGCPGQCGRLHLCKYHLKGFCRNQLARKGCKFVHNFHSDHNLRVLKQYGLENLNHDELCQLLLQNDPSLLPECRFGSSCKRSHDLLNPECFEKLERQGMSSDIIEKLPSTYRNMYDIKNGNRSMYDIEDAKSSPCKEKCIRTHFHLPYRWQYSEGNTWKDFENLEEIEAAYCDPKNVRFDSAFTEGVFFPLCISFHDMCCGLQKVRRLSTASSVTKPPHFILTTEWIWYWKDEYGIWQEYGKQDDLHAAATVSSDDLEKVYLAESSPKLTFKAGRHEYEINFVSMMQKNLRYRTERKICRRPKFVSRAEVEQTRARGVKHTEGFKSIPAHWDKSALPELGFKLIELDCSSEEYKKVKVDFQRTMPRAAIKKICRVQNPSLWELYQWQKDLMQKSNGGKAADERFLFHGTSKKDIDAICQQNFDWRICGLHGTVYGKGSYFARDASYSDNYCGADSHTKTMFLARVLVGEFTLGSSDYVRPPMKDSQNFYDSCVNNSSNPSIFVIFEKQQVYPEYLIEYQALSRLL